MVVPNAPFFCGAAFALYPFGAVLGRAAVTFIFGVVLISLLLSSPLTVGKKNVSKKRDRSKHSFWIVPGSVPFCAWVGPLVFFFFKIKSKETHRNGFSDAQFTETCFHLYSFFFFGGFLHRWSRLFRCPQRGPEQRSKQAIHQAPWSIWHPNHHAREEASKQASNKERKTKRTPPMSWKNKENLTPKWIKTFNAKNNKIK